jgi:hypothetical protein
VVVVGGGSVVVVGGGFVVVVVGLVVVVTGAGIVTGVDVPGVDVPGDDVPDVVVLVLLGVVVVEEGDVLVVPVFAAGALDTETGTEDLPSASTAKKEFPTPCPVAWPFFLSLTKP